MLLATVSGHVVATAKHGSLEGKTLLLVVPQELDGTPRDEQLVAVDGVGAGVGERVLIVLEGRSAGEVARARGGLVDAAVVGVVDRVDLL